MRIKSTSPAALKASEWRAANPEKMRQHQRKYRENNKEKLRQSGKRHYESNRIAFQIKTRQRKYGLKHDDFLAMIKSQCGDCALCGKPLPESHSFIAVDHCHKTGRIRGLLHRGCNVALGAYENHREAIEKYLKIYGEN